MNIFILFIASFSIATAADAEQSDFEAACSSTIDPTKEIAFERCVQEQKEAFGKTEALKKAGHSDIVNQCVAIDHKPGLVLGEPRKYTNWKRVEACTRAYL